MIRNDPSGQTYSLLDFAGINLQSQSDRGGAENDSLTTQASRTTWRPIAPPRRGEPLTPFYISVLLPGLSTAFLQQVLCRSYTSVRKYRTRARDAAALDPDIASGVQSLMVALTPYDGLLMARMRGRCQLPFWSRMAIAAFRKAGFSIPAIAGPFRCSERTVVDVLRRCSFLVPERSLAPQQRDPPGKFRAAGAVHTPVSERFSPEH